MTTAASPGLVLRSYSGATYRFDAGALCLELLPTGGPGPYRKFEVLHEPEDLAAWVQQSRLDPTPELDLEPDDVVRARRLRNALFRAASAHAHGEAGKQADLRAVNRAAAEAPLAPTIGPGGERRWARPASGSQLLATVARDAVELFTGPFAHRVRTCAADDCQLVYVDTSRPGKRRWCSMEHCGNLHKVRTLRARRIED